MRIGQGERLVARFSLKSLCPLVSPAPLLLPHSPFPIPHSQFPIPNSQCNDLSSSFRADLAFM
ncbi:MAG: hypothetical protein V7K98_05630 [Nostoc sp.]|uniref:hypothetical protein n=1 Tax=Nostoc sp. TaxID=1180 RepID=UPI002FFAD214